MAVEVTYGLSDATDHPGAREQADGAIDPTWCIGIQLFAVVAQQRLTPAGRRTPCRSTGLRQAARTQTAARVMINV
ncbi:hypothetical protein [Brevundimonas sp. TSRC1-1]|jgi:hypothetical protein|uniref:hypothetical protein n=1 Tax=Brevundimonas sp. TSRC1-1 TaxID=2804562 RepID=UPI003CED95BC